MDQNLKEVSLNLSGRELSFKTGDLARQANGAVRVSYGETVVLVAVVGAPLKVEKDFFPLTVDYRQRTYAAGKIPQGFFKREGKPRSKEVLTSRITDRTMRPLFPEGMNLEVQIAVTVLSFDMENDADILAINGASAALCISDIPFNGPIGAVRVVYFKDRKEFVVNPTLKEVSICDLEMVVAGNKNSVVMIEGGAKEVDEQIALEAIAVAQKEIAKIVQLQEELVKKAGKEKMVLEKPVVNEELAGRVKELGLRKVKDALQKKEKQLREKELASARNEVVSSLKEAFPEQEKQILKHIEKLVEEESRRFVFDEKKRLDGRSLTEVRQLTCQVGVLPRTHGSAVFTRGQTQSLGTTTLGSARDMQIMDELEGEYKERFLLHYNFPSYATGEVKPDRGPGRREIGHGALAEKALRPVLPSAESFPYTIRVVSDILESNGSSSMASVCSGTLSLMDAGVPITAPVAGIAMGLLTLGQDKLVLTDIMGSEDHYGDMDFKVAGTKNGITAIQMDIKISEIDLETIKKILEQAKSARLLILEKMAEAINVPREKLSDFAPKMLQVTVPISKIRDVIGSGGKTIRKIQEETGAELQVEDDGRIFVSGPTGDSVDKARQMIELLTAEAEVGKIYKGKVVSIVKFGAFVEILPGKDGLVHISQLDEKRVERVEDAVKEGQEIYVKVLEVDSQGRVSLSKKAAEREMKAVKAGE
ncbi:MAG: polyribonucleotide nucleotidyltransferase [Elusimicrobiota bacterium]